MGITTACGVTGVTAPCGGRGRAGDDDASATDAAGVDRSMTTMTTTATMASPMTQAMSTLARLLATSTR